MTDTKLKIGPIPDQTPVKMSIQIAPDLQADLEDYVQIYCLAYGGKVKTPDIIPSILRAFMDSDAGFKRARKRIPNTRI